MIKEKRCPNCGSFEILTKYHSEKGYKTECVICHNNAPGYYKTIEEAEKYWDLTWIGRVRRTYGGYIPWLPMPSEDSE